MNEKKESAPNPNSLNQMIAKPVAKRMIGELVKEYPNAEVRRAILSALEKEQRRSEKGESFRQWREAFGLTPELAGVRLGLSVEDIEQIEAGELACPLELLHQVRRELKEKKEMNRRIKNNSHEL